MWNIKEGTEDIWDECAMNNCHCLFETKTLNCWNNNLTNIPSYQTVPMDVITM